MATATKGWFVDPVGRFDGRLFDGQVWTAQVSQDGALTIDPDWVVPNTELDATERDASNGSDAEPENAGESEPSAVVEQAPTEAEAEVEVQAATEVDTEVQGATTAPVDSAVATAASETVKTESQPVADGGDDAPQRSVTHERRGGSDRRQVNIEVAVDRRRGDRRIRIPSADE